MLSEIKSVYPIEEVVDFKFFSVNLRSGMFDSSAFDESALEITQSAIAHLSGLNFIVIQDVMHLFPVNFGIEHGLKKLWENGSFGQINSAGFLIVEDIKKLGGDQNYRKIIETRGIDGVMKLSNEQSRNYITEVIKIRHLPIQFN